MPESRESGVGVNPTLPPDGVVPGGPVTRIPDVVLRVLPDCRAVEVQVGSSTAPPPPADEDDAQQLSEQLEVLAEVVRNKKRGPDGDVGPDFARCFEPRDLDELLPEESADHVAEWVGRAFERAAKTEGTYRLADEDGTERTFHVTVQPGDSDGIVTIRDVTLVESSDVLHGALERGELVLRYGPRVAADGEIVGGTATVFHQSDEISQRDLTGPSRAEVDDWAIHAVVRHLAGAAAVGMRLPIAVEASAEWLHRQGMAAMLAGLVECYGAPSELLELRATYEAWFGRGVSRIAPQVRELGCKVVVTRASAAELMESRPPADGWTVEAKLVGPLHVSTEALTVSQELELACTVVGLPRLRDRDALASLGFTDFEGACFGDALDGRGFLRRVRELNR